MFPGVIAQTTLDKPAVVPVGSGRTVIHAVLNDRRAVLASALHALGLRKGDLVPMLADNAVEVIRRDPMSCIEFGVRAPERAER